jgi:hypothetical protein
MRANEKGDLTEDKRRVSFVHDKKSVAGKKHNRELLTNKCGVVIL